MSDSQERPHSQQSQEGAVKVDQIRNIQGGTLLRTIPTGQPARFMMTPVQSSSLISTTTTIQAQVLPKGTVPPGTRLSAIPVATSSTGYHVPRGAAAVASIAVPRASVATPIVRATGQQLQAIGVAPPQAIASASSGSIVGRSVVGVTPWMTACLPQNAQRQQPQIRPPMTTTKLVSGQIRPVSDGQSRPVLLHSTTTKQVTLTQQAQVQVTGEKVLKSYGGANQGARLVTPVSTPPLSRIATSLPPMVSLHPAVLVSNNSSLPIKAATTQAKVIAQPAHGTTMQFTPVPASSQPAIAINSVVARPGLVTVMLTSGTPQSMSTSSTIARLPHPSKTESLPQSAFVHAQPAKPVQATLVREQRPLLKDETSVTTSNSISLSNTVYTFSGNAYFDSQISRNSTSSSFLTTQPSTSTNSQGASHVRPVMVVDTSRTSYIPPPDVGNSSSTDSSSSVSTLTAQNLPSKPTTSPRPSILRKRDPIEGSPMKGQKNLTPVLASMGVSAGSPPGPGSPKRPESGHSGQSSAGSTTISANSSPGESPTIKQEVIEDEPPQRLQSAPVPPQTEMSPRKKPRKQQLTGNQINEATYSDNEMEFISEDKIKREIKEEPIFEEEKVVPKKNNMSLISTYKQSWKVKNNHFLRYSDVKSKDDRKPTLSELANQKNALKRIEGWKVHHLVTQIEDTSNAEGEYLEKFSYMLKLMEPKKSKNKEFEKDLHRVTERIKANQQRSKVVKDQMNDAKAQVLKIFDQKEKAAEIIRKNITKRTIKKRERL